MTTGCRIQLYGHQYLNPIIKPTLKTVPMNCHSAIVYPFSNHIKNGIKKTLICLQAVIMLSEKNITNTASHSWIGIFFCQGHFNQVSTTKCDISVSLETSWFRHFFQFFEVSENLVSLSVSDNFVSVSGNFSKQRFLYLFWKVWSRKCFHIGLGKNLEFSLRAQSAG